MGEHNWNEVGRVEEGVGLVVNEAAIVEGVEETMVGVRRSSSVGEGELTLIRQKESGVPVTALPTSRVRLLQPHTNKTMSSVKEENRIIYASNPNNIRVTNRSI